MSARFRLAIAERNCKKN